MVVPFIDLQDGDAENLIEVLRDACAKYFIFSTLC